MQMIDLLAFGIILDDIVAADSSTHSGLLGGGGPQTAFGMRLPAIAGLTVPLSVGIASGVGADFPERDRAWLVALGIDTEGLVTGPLPTVRARQSFQPDGTRTQQFMVDGEVVVGQLARSLDRLPVIYREPLGVHLGVHPDDPDLNFLKQLARLKGKNFRTSLHSGISFLTPPVISVEPFRHAERKLGDSALRALCSGCDIFSPNEVEARSLVGDAEPVELGRRLVDAGASIVALRMGDGGSVLVSADSGRDRIVHVPAVAVDAVDPTGAGNAYCGALLAGLLSTGDLQTAGRYGAVAASFLVEQFGLPRLDAGLPAEARRRFESLA